MALGMATSTAFPFTRSRPDRGMWRRGLAHQRSLAPQPHPLGRIMLM